MCVAVPPVYQLTTSDGIYDREETGDHRRMVNGESWMDGEVVLLKMLNLLKGLLSISDKKRIFAYSNNCICTKIIYIWLR